MTVLSVHEPPLSHDAILFVLFFGVVAPTGLLVRLLGRDPMRRRTSASTNTYWRPSKPSRSRASYFRQS